MNSEYIKERIEKIRNLISEARYDEAFEKLEQFIAEIEGEEIENIRERELLDQLISVKSRYNFFKQQVVKGIEEGQTELNQIASALLSLTNKVNDLGLEDPALFKPQTEEKSKKEYYAEMATEPPLKAIHNVEDKSQNSGCLLAINNKNANVNVEIKDFNWSRFFLRLLIGVALVGGLLFFLLREGCTSKKTPVEPPVIVDAGGEDKPIDEPSKGGGEKPTVPRGVDCAGLKLSAGLICDLADFLSNSDNSTSTNIDLDQLVFKNSSLGFKNENKANQQLDDLVKLMNAYLDLELTVLGYYFDGEDEMIKGSDGKVMSMDDIRARKVYELLKSKGVNSKRMDFEGDGDSNKGGIRIKANL